MEFLVKSGLPHKQRTPCIVIGLFQGRKLTMAAQQLDDATQGELTKMLRRGDIDGTPSESLLLYDLPGCLADRVLLMGCGKERDLDTTRYIEIQKNLAKYLKKSGITEAVSYLTQLPVKNRNNAWLIRLAIEAMEAEQYRYTEFKKSDAHQQKCKRLILTIPSRTQLIQAEQAAEQGKAIANAVTLCRHLGNTPANICDTDGLVAQAKALSKQYNSIQIQVLDKAALEKENMHSLLAVGRGSVKPSYLIEMSYQGAKKKTAPTVLIGKGVVFDSGGLCLKPMQGMIPMKFDMCGAATVIAVMQAVATLKLPINVVGLVPTVENMPSGDAYRPSDVITTKSGITVEVLNTDAEGRMILCDALTYAERFNPHAVIDVATLTGAIVVALGNEYAGVFGNHQPLINALIKSGQQAHDEAWAMPIGKLHLKQIESSIADIKNIGGPPAASCTAAAFLSHFAKRYHWAHLDIAGVSHTDKSIGGTGRPVSLLVQYLMTQ